MITYIEHVLKVIDVRSPSVSSCKYIKHTKNGKRYPTYACFGPLP